MAAPSPHSSMMAIDTDKLAARIDFYESCMDQLKKDLPKYLRHQSDANRTTKLLVKVLKNAASAETNQKLQCSLFLHAQKCESLELQREIFIECESLCESQVSDAKTLLISPLREILNDRSNARKKAISQGDPRLTQETEQSLPIHADLFEKHRIKSIKTLLTTILLSELKFHCKAVEDISLVLTSLKDVDERFDT